MSKSRAGSPDFKPGFDKGSCRAAWYQVPDLPELECLNEKSELSRNGLEITKGILQAEKIEGCPVCRL